MLAARAGRRRRHARVGSLLGARRPPPRRGRGGDRRAPRRRRTPRRAGERGGDAARRGRGRRRPAAPPAFSGYRYTEVLEHWRWRPAGRGGRAARRELGRPRLEGPRRRARGQGPRGQAARLLGQGRTSDPFAYGDGPLRDLDIAALPTEPRALLAALDDNNRCDRTGHPGLPTAEQARYDITRSVLLLLGTANTTPSLRAALWGVLALLPGLQPVPDARDPLGREGEAVTFSLRPGEQAKPERFRVIFDPETSELLSWSLDGRRLGDAGPDAHLRPRRPRATDR